MSRAVELGLMGLSFMVTVIGIALAWRVYVVTPEMWERWAARFAAVHRLLSNKYYVDELYGATFIAGTFGSARGLWAVDRNVVDGMVNGSGWVTIVSVLVAELLAVMK